MTPSCPRSPTALSSSPWHHRRGYVIDTGSEVIELSELQEAWESGIESVFAYRSAGETAEVETIDFRAKDIHVYGGAKIAARA